jgi:deazaflavin-dependent oxidoreductase (nitroreductase family)
MPTHGGLRGWVEVWAVGHLWKDLGLWPEHRGRCRLEMRMSWRRGPVPGVIAVGSSVASGSSGLSARPLMGLRRKPGRVALMVFRLPLVLYQRGWGGLLGGTFLLLVHSGRRTGNLHQVVAMVLRYDPETGEAVICSAWGQDADWVRNIRARPAVRFQIGRDSFTPQQRFLSQEESMAVLAEFVRRHPGRSRVLSAILDWGDLRSDTAARDFVRTRPFVSLRPAGPPHLTTARK